MRDSVKQSLADSPVKNFERWPKGTVILCNACAKPIFKLDRGITPGDKVGRSASAFKPLGLVDLMVLAARPDIDAGLRALVRNWTPEERTAHVAKLHEVRSGEPMLCPCCHESFVQVLAVEKHAVLDKAYAIDLLGVPPEGMGRPAPVRGKHLGANPGKDWMHADTHRVH